MKVEIEQVNRTDMGEITGVAEWAEAVGFASAHLLCAAAQRQYHSVVEVAGDVLFERELLPL